MPLNCIYKARIQATLHTSKPAQFALHLTLHTEYTSRDYCNQSTLQ